MQAIPDPPTQFVPENVRESRAMVLFVMREGLFPFHHNYQLGYKT